MINKVNYKVVFDRKHEATASASKAPKTGAVQISVSCYGERRFISTGVSLYKNQWRFCRACNRPDAQELNGTIDGILHTIAGRIADCDSRSVAFSVAMLDDLFFSGGTDDFLSYMEKRMTEKNYSPGTVRQHQKVLRFLRAWGRIRSFSDLTAARVRLMDEELHRRGILDTSIYTYHKVLKAYINDAIVLGVADENPYDRIKVSRGEARHRDSLTLEEVKMVETLVLDGFLGKIRDLFMLQVYTGFSYCDLMAADWTQCRDGLLNGYREKTRSQYSVYIMPAVQRILGRYGGGIPRMCYNDYNRSLQTVIAMAGIRKHITTHCARHTFAMLALNNGIPIEVLARMMGHNDIKTTQIYARINDATVESSGEELCRRLGGA